MKLEDCCVPWPKISGGKLHLKRKLVLAGVWFTCLVNLVSAGPGRNPVLIGGVRSSRTTSRPRSALLILLVGSGSVALREAVQPTPMSRKKRTFLGAAPLVLLIAAAVELVTLPPGVWLSALMELIRAVYRDGATAIDPCAGAELFVVRNGASRSACPGRRISRLTVRCPGSECLYASLH